MHANPLEDPLAVEVAALARAECARPENRFGASFVEEHLSVVVDRALSLAPALGADPLAVVLSGWLHDLAAVRDFSTLPFHSAAGAELARVELEARGAAPALVEKVAGAVAAHSAPAGPGWRTPEQVCLASADVLAQLARPAYWCFYLYRVRGMELDRGLGWLRERAGPAFLALGPEARALGSADRARLERLLEPPAPFWTLAPAEGRNDDGSSGGRGAPREDDRAGS